MMSCGSSSMSVSLTAVPSTLSMSDSESVGPRRGMARMPSQIARASQQSVMISLSAKPEEIASLTVP